MKFNRYKNIIRSPKEVYFEDTGEMLAALHDAIDMKGYFDIILDFSRCKISEPEFMLVLCAQALRYRSANVDIDLILQIDRNLKRLFVNTNWAFYISPNKHSHRTFNGYAQVPATLFKNPDEQYAAVSKIIDVILTNISGIKRSDFSAFEWAINEMTDNVLVHSESHSGFVQVSNFRRDRKRISFIVCDIGVGIPNSLRSGLDKAMDDAAALREAIKEGVTRDKAVGQGNGLFGSHKVSVNSGGIFKIRSGYAQLIANSNETKSELHKVPFGGKIITAEINFSSPGLLENALNFKDGIHEAWSRIESIYEDPLEDVLIVRVKESVGSYGSRKSGHPLRTKIKNLMDMHPNHLVVIDFSDVALITSSFADEVLGKLLIEIGAPLFKNRIRLVSLSEINESIVNRSISQRMTELYTLDNTQKTQHQTLN